MRNEWSRHVAIRGEALGRGVTLAKAVPGRGWHARTKEITEHHRREDRPVRGRVAAVLLMGGRYAQYLIVTTEALAYGFADLAAFRSSPEGGSLTVRVTTVEAIHAARSEATPEARIRAAIAAEYASGDLRWVVLGARADAIAPVMV